ncbi:carboxymuconolactone decarboxylase family protein, partial [Micrococcus luteus]|uniref:carboxymuconolactone decarboxylase family protein n=1 Tax=Micrococcus luteus TaxID=1270 RepID=UPI000BCE446A
MNRAELSSEKYKQLFGNHMPAINHNDPDLQEIMNQFIFGEVYWQGNLDDKTRELITLVVLT